MCYFESFRQVIIVNVARQMSKLNSRPRWDSNPQSLAPEASALSIRPRGPSFGAIHYVKGFSEFNLWKMPYFSSKQQER